MGNSIRLHRGCRYFKYLREEPSIAAHRGGRAHVAVKTQMLQLRLMEKQRELVRREDVDALIDRSLASR